MKVNTEPVVAAVEETVTKSGLFTPKRLLVAGLIVVGVTAAVFVAKKLKSDEAEEIEETPVAPKAQKASEKK